MRRVLILNRQLGYRYASTKAVTNEEPLVVSTILNGVVTLRLNRPKKLNGKMKIKYLPFNFLLVI